MIRWLRNIFGPIAIAIVFIVTPFAKFALILYRLMFLPASITLNLGEDKMNVGQIVIATATEKDTNGLDVPVVAANLQFTFDNPAVATIAANGDGTATITAVGEGTGNALVTDTKFGLTSSPVSVTVEKVVTPGQPTVLVLTLGIPHDAGSPSQPVSATGAQKIA